MSNWNGKERRKSMEHLKGIRRKELESVLAYALIPAVTFGFILAGYGLYLAVKYVAGIV